MTSFAHGRPANPSALRGNDAAIAVHGACPGASRGISNAHHVQYQEKSSRPRPGERFRLFTAKGPVLFEVLEREFQFLSKSTTVRLTLDIPSEL